MGLAEISLAGGDKKRALKLYGQALAKEWPAQDGSPLRLDEAMHPLTLLTVGMYGETLPMQDGAPVRMVIPWKYGFKSIKSLVKIKLVSSMPPTTWNLQNAHEFGALSRNSAGGLFHGPFAGFAAFSIFAALAAVGRRPVTTLGWQPRHRCGWGRFFLSSGLGAIIGCASIIESKT
jgi:hypothetical protein